MAGASSFVAIGLLEAQLREVFEDVEQAAVHSCRYCMDYENSLPIFVCRRARKPYGTWWAEMRWYGGAKKTRP